MFNYFADDVRNDVQQVKQQALKVQEIDGRINLAVDVVRNGGLIGEAEVKFLDDAARLHSEIDALRVALEEFSTSLTQAAGVSDEAIAQIHAVVANLP